MPLMVTRSRSRSRRRVHARWIYPHLPLSSIPQHRRPSHVFLLPPRRPCTSFTETLGNLRSELEDLDAHLVSVQLSAESHPQKATMRPLRAGYNLPKAFAGHHTGEELRTTLPNLLAHLRRASSSISLLPATASPAKPMAQARHGIEYLRVWWSRGYGVRRGES